MRETTSRVANEVTRILLHVRVDNGETMHSADDVDFVTFSYMKK